VKVSIVIPTWQGENEVAECLRGIFAQHVDFEVEVIVIDSSSTDRTREIVKGFPVRLLKIRQSDFDHGDSRNYGAMLATGEIIVFVVQDAYPLRRDWLARLVSNFRDPAVAGVYCRIVPRPNAGLLVLKGVHGDLCFSEYRTENQITDPARYLAMDPLERRIYINYNDVASAMRREVWERLPYARVQFGEDLLWARSALEAGYKIVFDPDAPVVHSHEYDPETLRKRTRIDAWLNRAYLDRICIRRWQDVLVMTERVARADRTFLREQGVSRFKRLKLSLLSFWYHFLEFQGFYEGSKTRDRLVAPRAVPSTKLKILFVVHGFPPETFAGTEVLTLSLAKALARRGHEVVVFHRVADPSLENYALRESSFDGLRCIQIANHLRFANIEETYANPHVEARFGEVLDRERPDVVHFEHLIHLSATLPRVASERGIASVLTFNDFWTRCPRVQLIRPNRELCSGKPPILGCAACVANRPEWVPLARVVSRPLRNFLHKVALRYTALVKKNPKWFRKLASDVANVVKRPRTLLDEVQHADFLIAPVPFMKSKLVEAGIPKERIVVSDYGMETDWLATYRRSPVAGKTRFGFIGSLVWHKGLETLARAFARISDANAELHIYGDTEGMEEFRATRKQIEQHVTRRGLTFHGRYDPKRLGAVLSGIDVLVVPSIWYENSPLAIHEAFQAGIPVLVSDLGGMRDLVVDGEGGLRFAAGDDAALAAVMQRFLADPGLAAKIAARAPAVKSVAENAAEMEIKYRQAIGIHLAHRGVWHSKATGYQSKRGQVEHQGESTVLLRPDRNGGATVEYVIKSRERMAVDLRLRLHHLAGENDVVLGGEVLWNGRSVLRVEPERGTDRELVSDHVAAVELRRGANKLAIRNRIAGPGGGSYHLRVTELTLERTGSPRARNSD
jgi:glycosyltransferase involved in cell wall biosynthesis/GT2 family glycosyltransferase